MYFKIYIFSTFFAVNFLSIYKTKVRCELNFLYAKLLKKTVDKLYG